MKKIDALIILMLLSTLISMPVGAKPATLSRIQDVRIWPSPESTRIVFDLSNPVTYTVTTLQNPYRVVIDFKKTQLATAIKSLDLAHSPIEVIRTGNHPNHTLRVVFQLKQKSQPKDFTLLPNNQYGHRLVIDLESSEKQSILALFDMDDYNQPKEKAVRPKPLDFIVAIDCGHGGEDPGAIGPRGLKEKEVVLAIGKELKRLLNSEQGISAFLTRNGDYYIGLRERMQRARKRDADLFISIHADAFKNPMAKGASVFVLSAGGASSEAASWLAESENRSDLVGGVPLRDKSNVLASVLLDLSQTASKQASLDVAGKILAELGKVTPLHKNHVEQAGFAVLKAPDVPSILVETGFISNPHTEKQLRNHNYQKKLARYIASGVRQYFSGKKRRLPHQTPIHQVAVRYKVVTGDTLGGIAKKHQVSIDQIRKLNQLRNDVIRIGQILTISENK